MWPPDGWRCTGEHLGDWTPGEIQLALCHTAKQLVGLCETDPVYQELLFPHDTKAQQVAMARDSYACALTCAGILRCIGVEHASLDQPYADQFARLDAMSRLRLIGGAFGVWEPGDNVPGPGDMVIIGEGLQTHVLTCDTVDFAKKIVHSFDAAREPNGVDVIKERARDLVESNGRIYLHDSLCGNRRVVGIVHAWKIKPTREWVLPPRRVGADDSVWDEDTKVD